MSPYKHLRVFRPPEETVLEADGNHPDPRVSPGHVAEVVAHAVERRQRPDRGQLAFHLEDRLHQERVVGVAALDPVEEDAAPDRVEVQFRQVQGRRAAAGVTERDADPCLFQPLGDFQERRPLHPGVGKVGFVGRGEVRVDARDLHGTQGQDGSGRRKDLPGQKADPPHARVDFQVDRGGRSPGLRLLPQGPGEVEVPAGGGQAPVQEERREPGGNRP
ncbi:MAG: hypothetical protein BWY88_00614 [Synergistetes bacterium ADurb.Bin520]|nr:MAG: hypothetical protein BWY88_00614 [Synergistetes bacterium ADurb.Bin520]